jgi:hypothetical protein
MTLADRPHYVAPNPISFGGPDDWAAATAMAAMIEGLAGVKDGPLTQTLTHPILAPRWDLGEARTILATVRYPASQGYVAYRFSCDPGRREITVTATGNAATMAGHFLLPPKTDTVRSVEVDGAPAVYRLAHVAASTYVDLEVPTRAVHVVRISY